MLVLNHSYYFHVILKCKTWARLYSEVDMINLSMFSVYLRKEIFGRRKLGAINFCRTYFSNPLQIRKTGFPKIILFSWIARM